MPGGVKEVERRKLPGWFGGLNPWPVVRHLRLALRRGRTRRRARLAGGASAPQSRRRARGDHLPRLRVDAAGQPRCVACGLCAFACPTDCITVLPGPGAEPFDRRPARFALDPAPCLRCGLCEEVCPEQAIALVGSWGGEGATVLEMEALLVLESGSPTDRAVNA